MNHTIAIPNLQFSTRIGNDMYRYSDHNYDTSRNSNNNDSRYDPMIRLILLFECTICFIVAALVILLTASKLNKFTDVIFVTQELYAVGVVFHILVLLIVAIALFIIIPLIVQTNFYQRRIKAFAVWIILIFGNHFVTITCVLVLAKLNIRSIKNISNCQNKNATCQTCIPIVTSVDSSQTSVINDAIVLHLMNCS